MHISEELMLDRRDCPRTAVASTINVRPIGAFNYQVLLHDLYKRDVQSLIVEGGSYVHSEFIRRRLWQKMIVFVAPMIVGGGDAPAIFSGEAVSRLTDAYRFRFDRVDQVGGDLMVTAYP